MKFILRLSAVMLATLMLFSCQKTTQDTTTATTPTTTAPTEQTQPIDYSLTLSYTPKSGKAQEVTGEGAIELSVSRAYQANSRTITTSDEMLQELINLKR